MKSALYLLGAAGALVLTSCAQTTLENRRDLYNPQTVNGPYTRMLKSKAYQTTTVTTTQTTETTTVTTGGDYKNVVPTQ